MEEESFVATIDRLIRRLDDDGAVGGAWLSGELSDLRAKAVQLERELHVSDRNVRESEARLQRAQAVARLGSYEIKVAEDPDRPDFEDVWSPEMYEILGLEPADHRPEAETVIATAIHPDDRARVSRLVEQFSTEARRFEFEYRVVRPDGTVRWVQCVNEPVVDAQGRVVRVLGTLLDITERRRAERLEQDLFQVKKMEALGRLASGIAHDFNNLLMGIMGCCRLAERKLGPDSPARPYIEEMRAGAERGTALTRQLLTFSRKRPVKSVPTRINAVIRDAEALMRQLLGEHIAFDLALTQDDPLIVADPGHIEQILMNLVVNARDAMPGGGRLSIETRSLGLPTSELVARRDLRPGQYVLLSVTDTGHGMEPEILGNVFEPFFTTKHADQGTGLGLTTVYSIVSQLGGFIHIDSEVGKGSTFCLYFPRANGGDYHPMVAPSDGERMAGKGTVVVVEDERLVRLTVCDYLRSSGYAVLEAASPEEAERLVADHDGHIDLLLTDMVMPGMSGRALAGRLIEVRPDMKVIFMSAYPGEWLVEQGHLEPGLATLGKPFSGELLIEKVRQVLSR